MTELFDPTGPDDARLVARTTPVAGGDGHRDAGVPDLLHRANEAGVLSSADVHVARRTAALAGEEEPLVQLAVALAVRAVRHGSVCLDLEGLTGLGEAVGPDWPDTDVLTRAVDASPLTTAGVLHREGALLYPDRYHRLEHQVAGDLRARVAADAPSVDEDALRTALDRLGAEHFDDEQRVAAEHAVRNRTTVLTGGPGTGKTSTVARILALLDAQAAAQGERMSVALAAPTARAAARLQESLTEEADRFTPQDRGWLERADARTLHRLLGWRRENQTRFRHDRGNRLGHDVVVVDECSMVDLTLMARLLEAVRPGARLLLVGDPHQLTSVGAGAVLGDVVRGLGEQPAGVGDVPPGGSPAATGSPVVGLRVNHRSTGDIQELATALRAGDADAVLGVLRERTAAGGAQVSFTETDDPADALRARCLPPAQAVRDAAARGDPAGALAALEQHRLLCAHRHGDRGVSRWNRQIEQWLAETTGQDPRTGWYVGRPLLVTANDYSLGVHNGDTGVLVPDADGRLRAWLATGRRDGRRSVDGAGLREIHPGRLQDAETMHATTIHKAQGGQVDAVTVLLPEEDSRLLTRELFYTAVTRARHHVALVGSEAAVRAAVATRAQRASGLEGRLRG